MKKEEIKELSIPELRAQIEAAEKAYRELKVTHAISPIDNPAKITKDRREIARLKTVLRQKSTTKQCFRILCLRRHMSDARNYARKKEQISCCR